MTSTDTRVQVDTDKLMAFVFRAVEEVGAALNCALPVMGDQPGYYRDLASHGPATAAGPAARARTGDPHAREWLNAQAARGFVGYDAQARRYALPAEHAVALTDEKQPGGPARPVPDRARHRPGRRSPRRRAAARGWDGTSTTTMSTSDASGSSGRVHGQPHHLLAARPGRRGRQAAARRQGSRRGIRAWRLHGADGPGL